MSKIFKVADWTPELVEWLRTNTPSCRMLPPDLEDYSETIWISFDDEKDELAYKLTWT